MSTLQVNMEIEVRNPNYTYGWKLATVIDMCPTKVTHREGDDVYADDVDITVQFKEGNFHTIRSALGLNIDAWRYLVRECNQCEYDTLEGGDLVPYGSSSVQTPQGHVCECPYMPDDIEDPYEHTAGGTKCLHFSRATKPNNLSHTKHF